MFEPSTVYIRDYNEYVNVVPRTVMQGVERLPNGFIGLRGYVVFEVFASGGPYSPQGFVIGVINPQEIPGGLTAPEAILANVISIANEYFYKWKLD